MHCKDTILRTQNNWPYSKLIPNSGIYSFKMGRALKLLASQQYTVSEIAGMLGYCDAKYFGKKFKDFYHVCPTDYIKSIIG